MDRTDLTTIFMDVNKDLVSNNKTKHRMLNVINKEVFEHKLEEYLLNMMGISIYFEYQDYKLKRTNTFDHFTEVRKYFENIIVNSEQNYLVDPETCITSYYNKYEEELKNHPLTSLFINAAKKNLSNSEAGVYVQKMGKMYSIGKTNNRNEENMPIITIQNIDRLELVLDTLIHTINENDTLFKDTYYNDIGAEDPNECIFRWILKNATSLDLNNVENFLIKYLNFIDDKTFDTYRYEPKKIGELLDDELFLRLKKSPVTYETPYYLSFMLKNNKLELPNIRFGIDNSEGKYIAHVIATQTSQSEYSSEKAELICDKFKNLLPKSKYFREYNPSHIVSLVIALGYFKGYGINVVRFPDYLPLRYQRFVLEGNKSEEEMEQFQHRITNKLTNNFFRLMEFADGIEPTSYPEMGNTTEIKLSDNITFENEFLNYLFNIGYNNALDDLKNQSDKITR